MKDTTHNEDRDETPYNVIYNSKSKRPYNTLYFLKSYHVAEREPTPNKTFIPTLQLSKFGDHHPNLIIQNKWLERSYRSFAKWDYQKAKTKANNSQESQKGKSST